MRCQWQELIRILPFWLREPVDKQGKEGMEELRLRLNLPPQIILRNDSIKLTGQIKDEDLSYILNAATKYSPWTAGSIAQGFITTVGGHRIGICGECVYDREVLRNISPISSICIRVAREIENASGSFYKTPGSILIIGPPGSGKTTFLRDLIKKISNCLKQNITVLDERREIFPYSAGRYAFDRGFNTDILSGCNKKHGLDMAIRTMCPHTVAVDEITCQSDCHALTDAAWCGVRLLATAHANSKKELLDRTIYRPLIENKVFQNLVVLHKDKTWHWEALD